MPHYQVPLYKRMREGGTLVRLYPRDDVSVTRSVGRDLAAVVRTRRGCARREGRACLV